MADNHATFTSTTPKTPAVLSTATSQGPGSNGVHGITSSPSDSAVYGEHTASGIGVFGRGGPSGGEGVFGQTASGSSGVYGKNTATGNGVSGESANGVGVYGVGTGTSGEVQTGVGVYGVGASAGVRGRSDSGDGVDGTSSDGTRVGGTSTNGTGVFGFSPNWNGVEESSVNATGVLGFSGNWNGVAGLTTNSGAAGVYGSNLSSDGGRAALFVGDVSVIGGGRLSVDGTADFHGDVIFFGHIQPPFGFGDTQINGSVSIQNRLTVSILVSPLKLSRIDHPLDPANKFLNHACVESADIKNFYDGIAKLDVNGEALVKLPDWFEALNRDFRFQLTPIGRGAPSLPIAEKISGNRFKISGGHEGMEVC